MVCRPLVVTPGTKASVTGNDSVAPLAPSLTCAWPMATVGEGSSSVTVTVTITAARAS